MWAVMVDGPKKISIHALREEGDRYQLVPRQLLFDFYPRPPRGGRRGRRGYHAADSNFYPRPPRGGRQAALDVAHQPNDISIHALREEGDRE